MQPISKMLTNWTGSEKTEELVRQQVRERWGEEEADNFSAKFSARPLKSWHKLGFRIKDDEFKKPLRSFVLIKAKPRDKDKDNKEDNRPKRFFKTVFLYHCRQTEIAKR